MAACDTISNCFTTIPVFQAKVDELSSHLNEIDLLRPAKSGKSSFRRHFENSIVRLQPELDFGKFVLEKAHARTSNFRAAAEKTNDTPDNTFTSTEPISKGLRYFSARNRSDGSQYVEEREINLRRPLFDQNRNLDLAKEEDRLKTFKNWRHDHVIKGDQLASRGFSYLGDEDRVQCVFCKGILRDWRAGDDALKEHHQHFPTCPFILNLEVGNIPRPNLADKSRRMELCSDYSTDKYELCNPGIDVTAAVVADKFQEAKNRMPDSKFQFFLDPNKRINTFRNEHGLLPEFGVFAAALTGFCRIEATATAASSGDQVTDSEDLAEIDEAKNFYVQCFACDLKINFMSVNPNEVSSWWKIHGEKGSRCPFISLTNQRYFPNKGGIVQPGQVTFIRRHRVEPREVRARLDLPLYCKLQSMFLGKLETKANCREMLFYVITERLELHGSDFNTPFDAFEDYEKHVNEYLKLKSDILDMTIGKYVDDRKAEFENQKEKQREDNRRRQESIDKKHQQSNDSEFVTMTEKELTDFNQQLKDNRTCKICMDKTVNTVFLPCGHLVTCHECAPKVKSCPVCRLPISSTVLTTL